MSAKIEVEVVGEVRSLERALAKAEAEIARFKARAEANSAGVAKANAAAGNSYAAFGKKADGVLKNLKSPAGAFAGALVAKSVFDQVNLAVNAGSNLNEQISKSNVVFGQSADEIQAWSKTTAESFGISRIAALEAAGTFGNITRSMGVAEDQSAQLSRNLVNLAGDLASFNNVSTDDALIALRAAIVGEYEPLRRLGSALSEARVQTQALAETGKRSAKELTNQEKVLARYHLILKDTSLAQGDAARTSESFANQQRQLAAKAADLQANLGALLLPVVTELVGVLNDAASGALLLGDAFGKLGAIDLGPLGKARDLFGDIANYATRIGPIGVVRNAADLYGAIAGDDNPQFRPDAASPGLGIGRDIMRRQADAARQEARISTPLLNLPLGFQNATLRAQNDNDQQAYVRQLVKNKQWYETQLQRAIDASDTKAINELRSSLEGTQSAIQGVYSQMAAETARAKADADRRRDEAKQRTQREAERLASQIDGMADSVVGAVAAAADVIGRMRDSMQRDADDFKRAALDRLNRRQQGRDTMRALIDARENLALAQRIGGAGGIRDATRQLEDAELARQRFLLEGSSVAKVGAGFNVTGGIHLYGVQNVDQLVAELQKRSKRNAPQSRGRLMSGGIYGIG